MHKIYLSYSADELSQDLYFIMYIKEGKNRLDWENFIISNPDFEVKARIARKIITMLQTSDDILSGREVEFLWQRIEDSADSCFDRKEPAGRKKLIKAWAFALAVLIFLGTAFTLNQYRKAEKIVFEADPFYISDTQLLMADGQSIIIPGKTALFTVDVIDEKIRINDDTSLSLSDYRNLKYDKKLNRIVVPKDKKSSIELEDGTKVFLNSESVLSFPSHFAKDSRKVYLRGEAYFMVAHDMYKPFIVNVNDAAVRVLGTTFNISAYPETNYIETVLFDGSVEIYENSRNQTFRNGTEMKPGQKAVLRKSDQNLKITDEKNAEFYSAWVNGWLPLSKVDLLSVFKYIEKYFSVQIYYEDTVLSDDLISGKLFIEQPIEDVMSSLSDVSGIKFNIIDKDKEIYITKP